MEDTITMEVTKLKYCDNCGNEVEAKVIERYSNYTFKGENFEIQEHVLVCDCGEELYDETLDTETMRALTKMYEERVGLSLEEIKIIRTQYGLSMDLFSRILGWSKSTIARYETGKYIPDSSHMIVLRRLKEHPEAIDEYYNLNKHKFNEKEQKKINEKLANFDQITVEKNLIETLNINYKLHENTIETGYSSFNIEKLINMILFFTRNGVPKTKLMKLLFYADFLSFKRNLLSISGLPYVRLPYGPVPKDHELLLSTIAKNDMIDIIEQEMENDFTLINIKALKQFDDTLFDDDEFEILRQVSNEFEQYGSVAISNFSHDEDGWINTKNREIISYDYAESLKLD